MANQDNPRYRYQRNRQSMQECEDVAVADKDAIGELMDALDPDQLTTTFVNEDGETETKSTNTLRTYVYGLKRVAEVSDTRLVDMDATDVNELMGALREGRVDHSNAKSDGYSKSYLKPWQAALRAFYRYHEDLGVTSNEIVFSLRTRPRWTTGICTTGKRLKLSGRPWITPETSVCSNCS